MQDQGSTTVEDVGVGIVVGDRYRLERRLGRGGFGTVWAAHDGVLDRPVAVKLLVALTAERQLRLRREVATLRRLDVPGVVELYDDGHHGDLSYIAMALVDGAPFPGRSLPVPWSKLSPLCLSLLETIDRIHAYGVLHRDIKPANVLVSENGEVTVLDFGLSIGAGTEERITETGAAVGTPAYMAPEILQDDEATSAADIFALGAMIYQCLSGVIPHEGRRRSSVLTARITRPARPLLEVAPEVPPNVAETVDAMLAMNPHARPRSGAEVAARLRGHDLDAEHELPWAGPTTAIEAAIARVESRRPARIVGASGSGRTRVQREALKRLRDAGWSVVRLVASTTPFGSLATIECAVPDDPGASLEDAKRHALERLRARLEGRVVLVVDEHERLDPLTQGIVTELGEGPMLMGGSEGDADAIQLSNLNELALRDLFAGPDFILHLREDAARLLHARTGGLPRLVAAELAAWERARLVSREGDAFRVTRAVLDRTRAVDTLRAAPAQLLAAPDAPPSALTPGRSDLAQWIALLGDHANLTTLAAVREIPRWSLEAELSQMEKSGLLHRRGAIYAIAPMLRPRGWTRVERAAAHARIATVLGPGAPGRWWHLLMALDGASVPEEQVTALVEEALSLTNLLAQEGQLAAARFVVVESHQLLLRRFDGPDVPAALRRAGRELLVQWLLTVLPDGRPAELDVAAFAFARHQSRWGDAIDLQALVEVALDVVNKPGPLALRRVQRLPVSSDQRIEGWRHQLAHDAARRCARDDHEHTLAASEVWLTVAGESPHIQAYRHRWSAHLAYRDARYAEAAEGFRKASAVEPWRGRAIDDLLRSAAAAMETFEFEVAAARAEQAHDLADEARLPLQTTMATWAWRTARYRNQHDMPPIPELIEAAQRLASPESIALVCFIEGTIAYRRDEAVWAQQWAHRAAETWASLGKEWPSRLARSLAIAAGGLPEPGEIDALHAQAADCPVSGLGIQIAALSSRGHPAPSTVLAPEVVRALAETVPAEHWSRRLDVISVDEARATLLG